MPPRQPVKSSPKARRPHETVWLSTTKSAPSGLETTKGKAVAAVGAAGAAAGAVAFWKKSKGGEPDVVVDPGEKEPTSVATTETPEAKAAKTSANGGSS